MPTINSNVADYLARIETLTNTNLQILKTLNDSFFTKKNHLYTEIDETTYVIPSFISLENKINMLQENFENLVKAPETSEAYFNFDGNTRAIEVRKYSHVPDSIKLHTVETYNIENNDIFKDFLTPVPYINLDMPKLPNDIVTVNVKKIIAKSDELKNLFKTKLEEQTTDADGNIIKTYKISNNELYGNMHKLLLNYKEDYDYVEYDTVYNLPTIKNVGSATYVIESVVSDIIDDDLNELITLKLRNNLSDKTLSNKLTYKLFDDTIEKNLQIGDALINFDGTGKVVITDIKPALNTITVKVVNGEYLNFLGTDSYDTNNDTDIHDLSKLRFYSAVDFNSNKYIKVPLEEDQYVFIAVAPLNNRMNIQAGWGEGIVIDTHNLKNSDTTFKTYYDNNVKNIGDVLFEMTSMITSPITELSQDTFERLTTFKPVFDPKSVSVMQINKHLNNSTTVKNIRDAYNQKKNAENQLSEIQTKIDNINAKLTSTSFDDANGIRQMYTSQLSKLNNQKNELLTNINNAINVISLNANAAEIPIENAKYRIRGFYVPKMDNAYVNNVIGIKVQYRYKNVSTELGNAVSINNVDGNNTYIYSDWNELHTNNKVKIANCIDGVYTYKYEESNENINEPSYNQIDIPISQGETVDIRIKLVYDFGQPYIVMTSDWSNIVNVAFPDEFAKDIPVLTIIEENNSDINTNRFNNILETSGVNSHIGDMLTDQNVVFYHQPDHIASGFYTEERRIIPLKDKLTSMSNDIANLKSEIIGVNGNCKISLSIGNTSTEIYSDRDNIITLEPYNNFVNSGNENNIVNDGSYEFDSSTGTVATFINICIANTGDTAMKLYSLFPGNRNVRINNTSSRIAKKDDYCIINKNNSKHEGVWFKYQHGSDVNMLQTQNQFITFRVNDAWTGEMYYGENVSASTNNKIDSQSLPKIAKDTMEPQMVIYPYISTKYGLCIDSDDARSYTVINPGSEIIIPMYCEFKALRANSSIEKTISFDLRTSLYTDPVNYVFKVIGKNTASKQDKLTIANKKNFWNRLVNPIKYNQIVK